MSQHVRSHNHTFVNIRAAQTGTPPTSAILVAIMNLLPLMSDCSNLVYIQITTLLSKGENPQLGWILSFSETGSQKQEVRNIRRLHHLPAAAGTTRSFKTATSRCHTQAKATESPPLGRECEG